MSKQDETDSPENEGLRVSQTFVHSDNSQITGKITVDVEGRGDIDFRELREAAHDIVSEAREAYADD